MFASFCKAFVVSFILEISFQNWILTSIKASGQFLKSQKA